MGGIDRVMTEIRRFYYRIELPNHAVHRAEDGEVWESRSVKVASRKAGELGGMVRRITRTAGTDKGE